MEVHYLIFKLPLMKNKNKFFKSSSGFKAALKAVAFFLIKVGLKDFLYLVQKVSSRNNSPEIFVFCARSMLLSLETKPLYTAMLGSSTVQLLGVI